MCYKKNIMKSKNKLVSIEPDFSVYNTRKAHGIPELSTVCVYTYIYACINAFWKVLLCIAVNCMWSKAIVPIPALVFDQALLFLWLICTTSDNIDQYYNAHLKTMSIRMKTKKIWESISLICMFIYNIQLWKVCEEIYIHMFIMFL